MSKIYAENNQSLEDGLIDTLVDKQFAMKYMESGEVEAFGDYGFGMNSLDTFEDCSMKVEPCKVEEIKPDPLKNDCFLYHLKHNIVSYDPFKLNNDPLYLYTLYTEYFNHLIETCRPNFPPNINVEEFADENKNNKKIKDMSKMNGGNSFIVYRKYLKKYLETHGINIPMQVLSPLSSVLWGNEPKHVKDHYRELSTQIKKLHSNHLRKHINKSCKTIRNEKDMKRNGGNSFMIYRSKLNKYLKSIGEPLSMTELSSLASVLWSREPDDVKTQYKKVLDKTKKVLNEEIFKLHFKQ